MTSVSRADNVAGDRMPGYPVVTIVITSYNHERYVGAAIESALGQTYPRTEVIVVDDGSDDSSRAVIERFGARCRSIFRANGGQAAASHAGFVESSGAIVMFLDSDDMLDCDAVEKIAANWTAGCVKAQFYLRITDEKGRPSGNRLPNIGLEADDRNRSHLFDYGYYPSPPTSGNAYARDFLLKVLPEAVASWRWGLDGYLIGLAPLYGRTVSIHRELGSYRVHGANGYLFSSLDLAKLRTGMLLELQRERAIADHAERIGVRLPGPLVINIPAHCKARMLSLRLHAASHPLPGDRMLTLLGKGLRAIWRFPHMSPSKRLVSMVGLIALSALPRQWIARRLQLLFVAERRRGWIDLLPGADARTISAFAPFFMYW